MNIDIVNIAYKLPDATWKLFESAVSQRHQITFRLFLHSQDPDVMRVCKIIAAHENVIYRPHGINRGLSKSWNDGILDASIAGASVTIIVNDDCIFAPGDVDRLAEYAVAHRENHIITCTGYNHHHQRPESLGYSCFAINPIALQKLGCFDQNFFPIYWEDIDYGRRADLAGLEAGHCPTTMVQHGGSATLHKGDPVYEQQHNATFLANEAYYNRKWGGGIGSERYQNPFYDKRHGVYIAPEKRHEPYDEYDRTDWHLVKV